MLTSTKQQTPQTETDRRAIEIVYTNYRGDTAIRRIVPEKVWYGATDWHPEEQWLLDAVDLDKNASRSFALKDIRAYVA